MHQNAAFRIPYQTSFGDVFSVNESSIVNDFQPDNPATILNLLESTKFFSDKETDLNRGVSLNVLVGFVIESTKEFYFASWPPQKFDLEEIGVKAFVDKDAQYPVGGSVLFRMSVSGRNISRIDSGQYMVLGVEGKFAIVGVEKMGKERRLTDEEVRKEKPLIRKDARSAKPESSRESSPASASFVPSQSRSPVPSLSRRSISSSLPLPKVGTLFNPIGEDRGRVYMALYVTLWRRIKRCAPNTSFSFWRQGE
jgi:hypothetical protein